MASKGEIVWDGVKAVGSITALVVAVILGALIG